MSDKIELEGTALIIAKLKDIYNITDDDFMELLGDSVFTAMNQNNYTFITIADMMKIADAADLVFIMNFQTVENYLKPGSQENESA